MELEPAHVAGANQLNEGMRACWDSRYRQNGQVIREREPKGEGKPEA